jgi:hypothetical protein
MTDGEIGGPDGAADEWWRKPAPPPAPAPPARPPEIPGPRTEPPGGPGTAGPGADGDPAPEAEPSGAHGGAAGSEWWRFTGVREEWRDTWSTEGQEGIAAAHEIGAHIGEAIASHLPDPHAAAARRGLDLRWLLLKYNVPAILIALVVTWGGHSGVDRMVHSIRRDGLFAPVGVVLFFVLLVVILMVLPVGAVLGQAVSHLVSSLAHGLVRVLGRAWSTPYIGYVLRLVVAVVVWSFVLAVGRLAGRGLIHFLTGA